MDKFDIKTQLATLYSAPAGAFVVIDVPELTFLMIDGSGNPNTASAYEDAVEALYAVAYTLKFKSKADLERDYVVPPLEGLWWSPDMSSFVSGNKDAWSWTMMIAVPDFIDPSMAEAAVHIAAGKKGLPSLSRLRVDRLTEGRAVQTLHVGSYDEEAPTLERLHHTFLPKNGLEPTGHHHEIYLGDPRKTPAAKLKTILRQPVRTIPV